MMALASLKITLMMFGVCQCQRLGPQLFTADRNITLLVRSPLQGEGGRLLRFMVTYLRLLSTLIVRVSKRLEHARRAARYLYKHNGPKFLRVKFTEDSLVKAFRWSIVELRHFRFLKSETVSEYELFTKCYKANLVWFL
uniref:Uncharacterized protein n=1 Tax=Cuerna arida TaxID=1464854 RepID=A0A1B6GPN9_9HEMI